MEAVERRADVITYSVLAEMEHFQKQRVVDFRSYMQRYLEEQIAFYRQVSYFTL
jgi:sorting nexin-9/18/33